MISLGMLFWLIVLIAIVLWVVGWRYPNAPGAVWYAPGILFVLVVILGLHVFGFPIGR